MGLANVLYELDYPMFPGNGTSPIHVHIGTIQCALGIGLVQCHKPIGEWD